MSNPSPRPRRSVARNVIPPWQPLTAFLALMAIVYALIFFTGDGKPEPKLGIDLQGGTRVVLTARTDDGKAPQRDQLDLARSIIEQRVNGLGVGGSEVVVNGSNIVITVPGDDGKQARALGQTARLFIRPVDPVTGTVPATPQPEQEGPRPADMTAQQQAAAIEEQRRLRQAPADADDARLQQLREHMAKMNCSPDWADPLVGHDSPDQYLVACSDDGEAVYLLEPKLIDGRDVAKASAQQNDTGAWVVIVDYEGDARKTWAEYTAANIGRQTAVTLDSRVLSAPSINSAITGSTEISGDFTQDAAQSLANALKYGSLPLSFSASEAETVSATLGWQALRAALIAGLIGLIAVLIYSLAYYRMLGFLAAGSLVVAGIMVYGVMVLLGRWIGFTLDLAGMAGLIIGIGMTADSFVVYFERIKDEMREGRSFKSAVPRGWASARRTIWTGNAVSFIASVIIYALAVGEVRGFAFTLGLSTLLDVLVVFLVTHPLVELSTRSKFLSKPSINGLGAVSEVARARRRAAARSSSAKESIQ
ncbi:protein-export membrane protein SecD [Gordonia hirsuta DSM 44140 = NBRC 16056]|uniref:Protein translocase subunit SecD n=1 Tax=Gordonia hirsuta DSM 44140 = NBRC 16056 TaxID=1121927 RepID=L7LBE0_9ACTN|nr:protein translocase subunit SecD [Gordonia hirsuta]GAC57358.1 protein-export membrane protein SecD [Gordonia hirsuta DSM 44140 = NBRC 16056]